MSHPPLWTQLQQAINAQTEAVSRWHQMEPGSDIPAENTLQTLVLRQHLKNFQLWHVEDRARRTDVDDQVIARCKREIDAFNQQRNDLMEQVDAWIVTALPVQAVKTPRYNTESMGAALDRMSILSLKIFHMHEQTQRTDTDFRHREKCLEKLHILEEQRLDLQQALKDLAEDYLRGEKTPKVYFQCKMYNDPTLNPELYAPVEKKNASQVSEENHA